MHACQRYLAALLLGALVPGAALAQAQPASPQAIQKAVDDAYRKFKDLKEGKNADYIPVLAKVPPNLFGVAVVTPDGKVYTAGDVTRPFSIQSISKVFTMAEVLQQSGAPLIIKTVGVDATGRAFNSIEAIEEHKGAEMNPLVNAGAIATTSLVKGSTPQQVWDNILGMHADFAGHPLTVDQEVYKSESDTNQRNKAIAMLMSAYERLQGDPMQAVDLYTRQCSISVNTRDLAVMAATLANGGRNPVTGKQVVQPEHVKEILAVMATAGLYDDTGKWMFETGLPAKSGVGGGILAVSPGRYGIAAFSPPLDEAGNSVRAQRAIAFIDQALHANPYEPVPETGNLIQKTSGHESDQ